jgi:hypothetical protein
MDKRWVRQRPTKKHLPMSAKVVAVRHIWWHTMQDCQRGDESIRETLWE